MQETTDKINENVVKDVVPTDTSTNRNSGQSKNKADTTKKDDKKPVRVKQKQVFMYLGPNIPGGLLFKGGLYKEMPEHLESVFEKLPEIKELFIGKDDIVAFKKNIENQGSEAYRIYQYVATRIREGALKNGL